MNRRKRSPVWLLPLNEFTELVKHARSMGDVLRAFALRNAGGNPKTVWRRIEEDKVDASHLRRGVGVNSGIYFRGGLKAKPLAEIMVKNSTYGRNHLKKRLIKTGMLKELCNNCGLVPEWCGKRLVLILDHKNGVYNDLRFDNLQLLCPNCNSQSTTFAGRNSKAANRCKSCGIRINYKAKSCRKHAPHPRKVVRPDTVTLQLDIANLGFEGTGRKYGVSGSAIRKWIKNP